MHCLQLSLNPPIFGLHLLDALPQVLNLSIGALQRVIFLQLANLQFLLPVGQFLLEFIDLYCELSVGPKVVLMVFGQGRVLGGHFLIFYVQVLDVLAQFLYLMPQGLSQVFLCLQLLAKFLTLSLQIANHIALNPKFSALDLLAHSSPDFLTNLCLLGLTDSLSPHHLLTNLADTVFPSGLMFSWLLTFSLTLMLTLGLALVIEFMLVSEMLLFYFRSVFGWRLVAECRDGIDYFDPRLVVYLISMFGVFFIFCFGYVCLVKKYQPMYYIMENITIKRNNVYNRFLELYFKINFISYFVLQKAQIFLLFQVIINPKQQDKQQYLKMSKFQSTVIDENFRQLLGGKQIKPPLIPSNTQKIYSSPGIYNLKGFYQDLTLRLERQKQVLLRIQQSSRKNLNATNQSMMTISASKI